MRSIRQFACLRNPKRALVEYMRSERYRYCSRDIIAFSHIITIKFEISDRVPRQLYGDHAQTTLRTKAENISQWNDSDSSEDD